MRILLLIPILTDGGAERVAASLLNQWSFMGNVCECILTSPRQNRTYHLEKSIPILYVSENKKVSFFKKISFIHREIINFRADFLVSFAPTSHFLAVMSARGTHCKTICSERNSPRFYPSSKIERMLRYFAFKHCDWTIFQTSGAQSYFPPKIINKSSVISNPVQPLPFSFKKIDYKTRKDIILFAGRLSAQKNIGFIIDSFVLFAQNHPSYSLEIHGDGPLKNELMKKAKELPCGDRIFFFPFSDTIAQSYSSSKVLVLSSFFEGVPNVVIEAVSFGLPVVALDCDPGGCREYVIDGKTGFLLPPDCSPSVFSSALTEAVIRGQFLSDGAYQKKNELIQVSSLEAISIKWIELMKGLLNNENS
jgi:GalNAc-alpha-(1->4)-GalNAc-alpha-(1->3)-diNAcBac-PP-undecaprenol alpha-1,4-N-acetyl-D-galactosaminyltransferase